VTDRLGTWGLRALVWGGLIVVWQVVALALGPTFLPTVQSILFEGVPTAFRSGYYLSFLHTLEQLGIGFGIALLIAIPLGALMGWSRVVRDLLWPYVNGLYVTPQQTLLPLLIIVFGSGLAFRAVVVVLFSFFYPLVNTVAGVQHIDRSVREATRAFCTPRRRLLRVLWLPAAAPYVITGIRLGFGTALTAMMVAELWVITGTGEALKTLGEYQQLSPYFAIVLMVTLLAVVATNGLRRLERLLRPWEREPAGPRPRSGPRFGPRSIPPSPGPRPGPRTRRERTAGVG
jgi:ABC-type nitrate/sulfonate/bicarbonate transport system permease component